MEGNVGDLSKGCIWRFDLSMILVLLGTQNNSFHRLLEKMDELIEKKVIDEKILVQAGYTKYESKNMRIFDLIPRRRIRTISRTSRFNYYSWRSRFYY